MEEKDFNCSSWYEGITGGGQMVEFACRYGEEENIKEGLKNVKYISAVQTKEVVVSHGGHGLSTRYDIVQHKYVGGETGYVEVLEIKNPPDGRCGIVVHEYIGPKGHCFVEFDSLEQAKAAFEKYWNGNGINGVFQHGGTRIIPCGRILTPWFYAIADELLFKDFVFPNQVKESGVYMFGRKFLVRRFNEIPTIKTCVGMGTEKIERYFSSEKKECLLIYWDDGTVWNEFSNGPKLPQPLTEEYLWIEEAMDKFRELLSGQTSEFSIDFLDGSKFVGKFKPADKNSHHKEGGYEVEITLKPSRKVKGEFYFRPKPEFPTLESEIHRQVKEQGKEIVSIDMVRRKPRSAERNAKKWAGVYPALNNDRAVTS